MAFSTDDRIATNEEQATGKKREELEAAARGESRFSLTPLRSAFGTYDNPVIVPSGTTSRIVGCQGGVEGVCFLFTGIVYGYWYFESDLIFFLCVCLGCWLDRERSTTKLCGWT